MEYLWEQGVDRNHAGFTLSGIQYFVRRKRILPASWRLLKCWQQLELPNRAPPMPPEVLSAMAMVAHWWKVPEVALLLVLGYAAFLRSMELLTLHVWQIQLDHATQQIIVVLPLTKSGLRKGAQEMVLVDDPSVYLYVAALLPFIATNGPILSMPHSKFRQIFKSILDSLNLQAHDFRMYSLRRGGATAYARRTGNLDQTLERGRWSDIRTARIYLTEGLQQLHSMQFTAHQRLQLQVLSQSLAALIHR